MRTDFFVSSFPSAEGERFVILLPAEIPASVSFSARQWGEVPRSHAPHRRRLRLQLREMGFSSDEVDYQLDRARGLHLSAQ
jgi:hypothetical protein